jgi:hypothetical protein
MSPKGKNHYEKGIHVHYSRSSVPVVHLAPCRKTTVDKRCCHYFLSEVKNSSGGSGHLRPGTHTHSWLVGNREIAFLPGSTSRTFQATATFCFKPNHYEYENACMITSTMSAGAISALKNPGSDHLTNPASAPAIAIMALSFMVLAALDS